MFPDVEEAEAIEKLWDAIFLKIVRIDQEDPIAAWHAHNETLKTKGNVPK
ncbi:hypothetical protein GCM10020331_014970 [Ectobacillus funiculus]